MKAADDSHSVKKQLKKFSICRPHQKGFFWRRMEHNEHLVVDGSSKQYQRATVRGC